MTLRENYKSQLLGIQQIIITIGMVYVIIKKLISFESNRE